MVEKVGCFLANLFPCQKNVYFCQNFKDVKNG